MNCFEWFLGERLLRTRNFAHRNCVATAVYKTMNIFLNKEGVFDYSAMESCYGAMLEKTLVLEAMKVLAENNKSLQIMRRSGCYKYCVAYFAIAKAFYYAFDVWHGYEDVWTCLELLEQEIEDDLIAIRDCNPEDFDPDIVSIPGIVWYESDCRAIQNHVKQFLLEETV